MSSEVRSVYLEFYPQLTPAQREAARNLMVDFRTAVDQATSAEQLYGAIASCESSEGVRRG